RGAARSPGRVRPQRRGGSVPPGNAANGGARLPKGGRFCPECGARTSVAHDATAVEEIPPEETGRVPVHTIAATPRYFGIAPPLALFALAVASLAAAIVVFVAGTAIEGAILLAADTAFLGLFVTSTSGGHVHHLAL